MKGHNKPRIFIAGWGGVGRALAKLLMETGVATVVGASDSRGSAVFYDAGCLRQALDAPRGGLSGLPCGSSRTGPRALEDLKFDVLVLATASSHSTGEPGLGYALKAIEAGSYVVAADKPPVAELLARGLGPRIFYKATVMAGTPLIDMLRLGLAGRRVLGFVGALNGTTNYIINLVARGQGFREAVASAVSEGIAEPDPSADLEGLDLAVKASIVAQTLGCRVMPGDVEVVDKLDGEGWWVDAVRRGSRVRFVALIDLESCAASVRLAEFSADSVFYSLPGSLNAAEILMRGYAIEVRGPGAGVGVTAETLLSDILLAGSWPPH